MPTAAAQDCLTAEEFFALPEPADGSRQELVRGKVETVPNPGLEHGEVTGNAYIQLKTFASLHKLGRVFVESGTLVDRNPDTVRGPDVSFYSKERLPLDLRVIAYHDQPPDLCVEVVTPSNTRRKLRDKVKEYFFAGVRAVWLIDPEDRSVTVFTEPLEGRVLSEGKILDGGDVLPGFACPVADLFGSS
jgi:Uma2 family endonuclease